MDEAALWTVRHGRPEPPPERVKLRAGPLVLSYQDGDLRWIELADVEILRRVYAAVRDRDWATYPVRPVDVDITSGRRSFRITYRTEHRGTDAAGAPIAARASVAISGDTDGTLRFVWDAELLEDMQLCRAGVCVLHPASLSGKPCVVEHVDGERETIDFPTRIMPWSPFREVRALTTRQWGAEIEVRVEGETFETEDQRNWSDGSFKTFSRPLSLPYPYAVKRGERIRHEVTLRLRGFRGDGSGGPIPPPTVIIVAPQDALRRPPRRQRLPPVGLSVTGKLDAAAISAVRPLAPAHLRIDLDLEAHGWHERLREMGDVARALDCSLEVGLAVPEHAIPALAELAATTPSGVRIASWLLTGPWSAEKLAAARRALPGAAIGWSRELFTLHNRDRPSALDVFAFGTRPQCHATDTASLFENLDGLEPVVSSAEALAGAARLALSPLSLAVPGVADPRSGALAGAAWLCSALWDVTCVDSLTWAAADGPQGVLDATGRPTPIWHVLADLAEFAGAEVLPLAFTAPRRIGGIVLMRGNRFRALVANVRGEPEKASVSGWRAATATVRILDERGASAAAIDPQAWRARHEPLTIEPIRDGSRLVRVDLLPYAVATIDGEL